MEKLLNLIEKKYTKCIIKFKEKIALNLPLSWSRGHFDIFFKGFILSTFISLIFIGIIAIRSTEIYEIPEHTYNFTRVVVFCTFSVVFYFIYFLKVINWRPKAAYFNSELFNIVEETKSNITKVILCLIISLIFIITDCITKRNFVLIDEQTTIKNDFINQISSSINFEFFYLTTKENKSREAAISILQDSAMLAINNRYPNLINKITIKEIISDTLLKDTTKLIEWFLYSKYYLGKEVRSIVLDNKYSNIFRLSTEEWSRYSNSIVDIKLNEIKNNMDFNIAYPIFITIIFLPTLIFFSNLDGNKYLDNKNTVKDFHVIFASIMISFIILYIIIFEYQSLLKGLIVYTLEYMFIFPLLSKRLADLGAIPNE